MEVLPLVTAQYSLQLRPDKEYSVLVVQQWYTMTVEHGHVQLEFTKPKLQSWAAVLPVAAMVVTFKLF
jgi:hypothetical protein